ncbi:MAG TPA: hypothetical protein VGB98_08685 [Pyrinomonadaceae bacterium]
MVALLAAPDVFAQNAPALRWELVNPFRFIHDQSSVDDLRDIYDGMALDKSTRPAYDLERDLQDRSEVAVQRNRATAVNCADRNATPEEKRQCFEPYAGWVERLARDNFSNTCWNPETGGFRNDVAACRDYVYPEAHYVRVWIENPQFLEGRLSTWLVDNRPLIGSQLEFRNCDAKYKRPFCVEIRVPYDANAPRKLTVSVSLSNGGLISLSEPIEVLDRLVVGLGDSYASGEGNPDRPARFTQGEKERDFLPALLAANIPAAVKGTQRPRKDRDAEGAARWLDLRCHRSMYSYQFKTALQMALRNPREAVTFVSYSCSGAVTDEIIDKWASAIERGGRVEPQLESLRKALTKDGKITREIDYLLLSTGGNDIEFSKYVTYAVLSGAALKLFSNPVLFRKGVNRRRIIRASDEGRFKRLLLGADGSYARLHRALLEAPSGLGGAPDESRRIRIKDCQPGHPCHRILLTPYPDILHDEKGNLCSAARKEFDNPFGEDRERWKRLLTLDTYVFRQIRDVQADAWITDKAGPGWTVVGATSVPTLTTAFALRSGVTSRP